VTPSVRDPLAVAMLALFNNPALLEILKASAAGDKAADMDAKAKRAPTEAADPDPDAGAGGVGDGGMQASGIVKFFNKDIDRLRKAVG
jgi:hypothetical protein